MKFLTNDIAERYARTLQERDLIARGRALVKCNTPWLPSHDLNIRLLCFANEVATGKPYEGLRTERAGVEYLGSVTYIATPPDEVYGAVLNLLAEVYDATPPRYYSDRLFVLMKAAQLHLGLLCIHPFRDGNGRTARLLERWFIARHFGPWAYGLETENYYRDHRYQYFRNLQAVGSSWDTLDLTQALPFLQMLPAAITHQLNS
jgi:Fic family protein